MYLRKIITNGFKSFADKVVITLDRNKITGIVGPNGSGKSNVIDAVRWVMGEQNTKMLRGEKVTDIIFSGSEKRKALTLAEVTLVFDNAEPSVYCPPEYRHEPEISLTRRIYSDGSKEFTMNKRPCRLKDILDFFAYTGLGGRSYSMIQQGQVDRILQSKPEELREVLEEAAGTLVFKRKLSDVNRKMETTKLNLSRIQDILKEIDERMDALKEQVERAQKWNLLTQSLKTKELALILHNAIEYKEQLIKLRSDLDELSIALVTNGTKINTFEHRKFELKKTLEIADPELSKLSEEMTVTREKIAGLESMLGSLTRSVANFDHEQIRNRENEAILTEELETVQIQYDEYNQQISSSQVERQHLQEIIEELENQLVMSEEQANVYLNRVDSYKNELIQIDRLLDSNRNKKESLEQEIKRKEKDNQDLIRKISSLESEQSRLEILSESSQVKVNFQQRELQDCLKEKQEHTHKITEIEEQTLESQNSVNQLKENYFDLTAKCSALKSQFASEDSMAQLYQEFLVNHPQSLDRVYLLANFLEFNQKTIEEYPKNMRNALDSWVQRLVFKDQEIWDLWGRFIENKSIVKPLQMTCLWKLKEDRNVLGQKLTTCFSFEHCDWLDKLLSFLRFEPEVNYAPSGYVFFSLNGHVLFDEVHGIFIGGQSLSLLGLKSQIQDLSQKVQHISDQLQKKENLLLKLREDHHDRREKVAQIEGKIQSRNKVYLDYLAESQGHAKSVEYHTRVLLESRQDYEKFENSLLNLSQELDQLFQNQQVLVKEKDDCETFKKDLELDFGDIEERLDELKKLIQQKKFDLISVKTQGESLEKVIIQTERQLTQLTEKSLKAKELLEEQEVKKNRLEEELDHTKIAFENYLRRRDELEQSLAEKKHQNAALLDELRTLEDDLKDLSQEMTKSTRIHTEKKFEAQKLQENLKTITDQAREKYQVNLDNTNEIELSKEMLNAKSFAKDIAQIKGELEGFGPINMMALQEFEELQKRQDFINKQKDEVDAAIELLYIATEEIEESSKNKFLTMFKILDFEFQELFPILFPGGEASLCLLDPEKPLNTGVEIMVRLPGKNRQSMRLFSGGEKALTAIALIFALLKSKPTPFCFLDEVDAPLDETNVVRYNRVLQALSDRFQFVVITHRRRTMEVLDTLYGITMQEPGVSKVVGVDLSTELPVHLQKAFKETPMSTVQQ